MSAIRISSAAVYCGSNLGTDPAYAQAATSLGRTLAEQGIRLVYGGGHVGLMGAVADAVIQHGGEAHGVITEALQAKEIAHEGLTSLKVVKTMHERKAAMADAADAFIMLPGGFGTFDELFGILTLIQNEKIPRVPVILMGRDFWEPLHEFIKISMFENHASIDKSDMKLYTITDKVEEALAIIKNAPISDWWEQTD